MFHDRPIARIRPGATKEDGYIYPKRGARGIWYVLEPLKISIQSKQVQKSDADIRNEHSQDQTKKEENKNPPIVAYGIQEPRVKDLHIIFQVPLPHKKPFA
jgi:hypothetical protein